jgi:autotransporter-associated beta strand protein
MTTTTTKHCGSAAPAFPTTSIVGHMPATTTTFGDHFMHASSTVSLSATRPASSARSHAVWQSVRAISRSLFGIVLAVAILLVFVARAPAQSWTPGTAYNAVTLSSNTYYTTPSYTPGGVSQFTVEAWINLPALGATDSGSGILELGSTIAAGEAMTLFTDWDDASQTHTLNFRIANGTSGTSTQASYTAATLSPGTWYHVAGSYDSSNMTVWLDGGSRTVAINPQSNPQLNFWNQNRWGSTTQSGEDLFLNGLTSGFRVWQGIYSPTQGNSVVGANLSGVTGVNLEANFQVGTNGITTPIVGSPDGGTLTAVGTGTVYTKYGIGDVTVTVNDYFLDTINAGKLAIGNGGTDGALLSDVVDNGTLAFNRGNALTHSNVISGTGIVAQDGAGTLTLSGVNSYAGETQVNVGTLIAANVDALGTTAGGTSVASGATLELATGSPTALTFAENFALNGGTLSTSAGGSTILTGTVALGSNSQLAPSATTELTIDGVISGAGGFTFNGLSLDLGAANTYDGETIVNTGNLFVTADSALGSTAGGTTVNSGGALRIDDVVYTAAEAVTLNGGSLDSSGSNSSFAGSVAVAADSSINVINNEPFTISGAVTGSSALEVGADSGFGGTLILTGANTYSGATTITRGTLQIGNGSTSGDFAASSVTNSGTLTFNRSGAISAGYAITGAGVVNQDGTGTLTLSGVNTYTGDTNVNAGTLSLTGSLTSDVIVAGGATIAGSGSSTGSLSGAGFVDPGSSPGILAFASLDASAGMDFSFEFTAADPTYSNVSNSANDVLRLTDATTPFTTALTSSNTVNIYLNVDSYTFGDEFRGGFFTDDPTDFLAQVENASFNYFLKDSGGAVTYNGVNYRNVTSTDWILTTVPATANFAGGTVNGQVLQVVPEPSSFVLAGFAIAGLAAAGYRRRKTAIAAASAADQGIAA